MAAVVKDRKKPPPPEVVFLPRRSKRVVSHVGDPARLAITHGDKPPEPTPQ